ncbi:MAG: endonuclease domain-containing protein [Candidatus Paceibacterota bacterium]
MADHLHNIKRLQDARISLRKEITLEEKLLWDRLRNTKLGVRFRRQHSIGNFIADFFCPVKRIIIELDGNQHLDNQEYDKERTEYFVSLGIRVIRFWNWELREDISRVVKKVEKELAQPHPASERHPLLD